MTYPITIEGVNFYPVAEDGSQTPEIRAYQASMYMRNQFEHGIPLTVSQAIDQEIVKMIHDDNVKNHDKLQHIAIMVHNRQVRTANILNTDNLLGLAAIYFYIDDEDPMDYTGKYDLQKINTMKKGTPEQILFFCQKAAQSTVKLTSLFTTDLAQFTKAKMKKSDDLIYSQRMITPDIKRTIT